MATPKRGGRAVPQNPGRQGRTVAATIRRTATRGGYSQAERKGADTCANYLTSKKLYLDYRRLRLADRHRDHRGSLSPSRQGSHGPHRSPLGLDGAEAILQLRALTANNDFDDYWRFHLRQEHHRVHAARYRNDLALAA